MRAVTTGSPQATRRLNFDGAVSCSCGVTHTSFEAACKTHFAVALGLRKIEQGFGINFVRAQDLLEDLRQAQAERGLNRRMCVYVASKLLSSMNSTYGSYDGLAFSTLFS
jgi:hypothetical protein